MLKPISFLKNWPVFFLLLPFFFVFHGWVENYNAIPVTDAAWLLLTYLAASVIIFFLSWLVYRNWQKAALFSFLLMAFHFFFGSIHDLLKKWFGDAFIARYSFLLPFFLIVFIVLFIVLKKKKLVSKTIGYYLNILFSVLIIIDLGLLAGKIFTKQGMPSPHSSQKIDCKDCIKPDIYFLVFDEYSSSSALKELWNYNNTDLDSFLIQKKFKILPYSKSNYNFTKFSIASTLNMDWLSIPDPNACTVKDYNRLTDEIRNSEVTSMLRSAGYEIKNYSIFDLAKDPSPVSEDFLPLKTKLITSQTFLSRLRKDLYYHLLAGRFEIKWLAKDLIYITKQNNEKIIDATLKESMTVSGSPKFIYSHIEMPHPPFYYDKNGREKEKKKLLEEYNNIRSEDYLDYLPQTNLVVKKLVNNILDHAKKPVVIILLGDHGFRVEQPKEYYFRNLNAVYNSSADYTGFYENITNINEFRVLFNNLFRTSFPLLKDSTVFLKDK